MADSLATTLKVAMSWVFQDALDLATIADVSKLEFEKSTTDGTGVDQADKIWHDTRTLATATNDDLDLNALTNSIFGSPVTINFAKVKAIIIKNKSTTSGDELKVGAAGTNPFVGPFAGVTTAIVEVGADSVLVLTSLKDGWTVTGGSSNVLRINNPNAGSVTYDIVIIGTA